MSKTRPDALLGTRIREYEILSIIGKGGMGAVYRARHVLLQKERAIKVIRTQFVDENEFVDRFIHEARMLTDINHPNVIHLYDFGTLEDQGGFFMVLELLKGETVMDRIQRIGRIPVYHSLKIIKEAALGLNSAHQKGIIHRDVSPDNLFLVKEDSGTEITKVIDFGIAKPNLDTTRQITIANMFLGKPEYCSPEQCGLLEPGEIIDRRSDIYSLAVTLYYMLSGELPFTADNVASYMYKQVHETPKPVSSHLDPSEISSSLDNLILKALSKKRENRHANLEQFISELDEVMPTEIPTIRIANSALGAQLQPGQLFARRYLVEKKLGEGGMGTVYKAIDNIIGMPVALKVLGINISLNPKVLERFKREVILARKVTHSNVCRIYDISESDGIHYVSMEFLEGESLAQMIKKQGPLQPELGIGILKQILLALKEAHNASIIHRDLKPQNIMVDPKYKVYIMDFGISLSSEMSRVTEAGVLVGTPFYMAPEQFEGKSIDHRTDIYSIGVIMFEIFTGKLPFQADSPVAVIFAHVKSLPPRPTELVPNLPPILEKIILKALEKEPQNRYQSVHELLTALEPLSTPQTGSSEVRREALAHRYLAEHSYSKAIKYLNHLLRTAPNNPQWTKLLQRAESEKLRRDLKRVKSLIQKNQLLEAQELFERIANDKIRNPRLTSQIQKLGTLLQTRKKQDLNANLKDDEKLTEAIEFDSTGAIREAAAPIQPDSDKVGFAQKKVQTLPKEVLALSLNPKLEEARSLLLQGNLGQADGILSPILTEYPGYPAAVELKEELQKAWKRKNEEIQITKGLGKIIEAWLQIDFDQASSRIRVLIPAATEHDFKALLEHYLELNSALGKAFSAKDFERIPVLLKRLKDEDSFSWLKPYSEKITQIEQESLRRQKAERDFQITVEKGRECYGSRQWKEAIRFWQNAQEIHPEDISLKQWIREAEEKLYVQQEIFQKLSNRLTECEEFLSKQNFEEVRGTLDQIREIAKEYTLQDLEPRISDLEKQLNQGIEIEKVRIDQLREEIAGIKSTYQKGNLEQALARVKQILKRDPGLKEASSLRVDIERFFEEKRKKNTLFQQAFGRGQEFYDQKLWKEAIETWKDALKILPDHSSAAECLAAAEAKQQQETRIREEIHSNLAKCKEFIQGKNFDKAEKMLNRCSKMITDEYRLDDISLQVGEVEQLLQTEKERENSIRVARDQKLSSVRDLLAQEKLDEAQKEIISLLQEFPGWNRAVQASNEIDKAITKRDDEVREFKENFDRGKQLFDQNRWEEAILLWQKADQIRPDADAVKECIASAEDCLLAESRVKAEAANLLDRSRKAISGKDYDGARVELESAQKLLNSQPRLDMESEITEIEKLIQTEENAEIDQMQTLIKSTPPEPAPTEISGAMGNEVPVPEQTFANTLRIEDLKPVSEPTIQISNALPLENPVPAATAKTTPLPKVQPVRAPYLFITIAAAIVIASLVGWWMYRATPDSGGQTKSANIQQDSQAKESTTKTESGKGKEVKTDPTTIPNQNTKNDAAVKIAALLQDAESNLDQQKYEDAIQKFQNILALDPANQAAKDGMAQANEQLKLLEEAKNRDLEIQNLRNSAEKSIQSGKWTAAEDSLKKIIRMDPNNAYAKERLGNVRANLQEEKNKQDQDAKVQRLIASGKSSIQERNFESATRSLNEALSLDASNSEAKRLLSQAQSELQKPRFGFLSITTIPTDAEIYIDGAKYKDLGLYPKTQSKVGQHKILIRREGYQDRSEVIEIKENEWTKTSYELKKEK
jgi:serine/threonine protein kinase